MPLAASAKLWRFMTSASPSMGLWKKAVVLLAPSHLLLNTLFTIIMLWVSHHNYPGGEALFRLHQMERQSDYPQLSHRRIHIDNYAAQTGVSRFGHLYEGDWIYDKTENLTLANLLKDLRFSHFLVENREGIGQIMHESSGDVKVMREIEAFAGIKIDYKKWHWPIHVKRKTALVDSIIEALADAIVTPSIAARVMRTR